MWFGGRQPGHFLNGQNSNMSHSHKKIYQSHWFYLFHALVVMVFIFPHLDPQISFSFPWALLLFETILLLTIVYSVSSTKTSFIIGLVLGAPAIISFWAQELRFSYEAILFSQLFLYIYAIYRTILRVLRSKQFSVDEIFVSTSLYLLIGLTWTICYLTLEHFVPGSFNAEFDQDGIFSWSDFLYYSFITLTTLGYGDIIPLTALARSLSVMEAVTGVIFVPVIISGVMSVIVSELIKKRLSS